MPAKTGRPRGPETRARTRDLLARIANGEPLLEAAQAARVKPERVLRLLDDAHFFAVYQAVRRGDLGPTGAIVHMPAPGQEAEAA